MIFMVERLTLIFQKPIISIGFHQLGIKDSKHGGNRTIDKTFRKSHYKKNNEIIHHRV